MLDPKCVIFLLPVIFTRPLGLVVKDLDPLARIWAPEPEQRGNGKRGENFIHVCAPFSPLFNFAFHSRRRLTLFTQNTPQIYPFSSKVAPKMDAKIHLQRFQPTMASKFEQFCFSRREKIKKWWSKLKNVPKSCEKELQKTSQIEAKMPQKRANQHVIFWHGFGMVFTSEIHRKT